MKLNKISYNKYSLQISAPNNSYCQKFEFIVNTNELKLPEGKMVIDIFATGEVYLNLSKNKVISHSNSNFDTVLNAYWLNPDRTDSFNLTVKDGVSPPNWVARYQQDGFDGWIIDTSLLLELEDNHIGIPVCKSFTGTVNSGSTYQSDAFSFANRPPFAVCSSEKIPQNKVEASPCAFPSNQSRCPFFEARYDVMETNSIKSHGSDQVVTFQLRVSPCFAGDAVYQIVNIDTNEISYSVNVELRTDETDIEIAKVFHDVMSTYQDGFTTLDQINNIPISIQKNSYILSLA